jgi:uncharacterized protein YbbK (DUF523 family)
VIVVSACLAGVKCRHDGEDALVEEIAALVRSGEALPVCPEQLGGLPTPRSPAEIVSGGGEDVLAGRARLVNEENQDVTREFLRGAEEVARLARLVQARQAILKSGSPSCGRGEIIYQGRRVPGNGVAAAALLEAGLEVREEGSAGDSLPK